MKTHQPSDSIHISVSRVKQYRDYSIANNNTQSMRRIYVVCNAIFNWQYLVAFWRYSLSSHEVVQYHAKNL